MEVLEIRPGILVFHVKGRGSWELFSPEPGGHRWQRVPPTEKRGRTHTSTVTVAVLREPSETEVRLNMSEVDIRETTAGGPGGQHQNKKMTAIVVKHLPTGITASCASERSQKRNKDAAMAILRARIAERIRSKAEAGRAEERKQQVGSGQRGDKVRTVQEQNARVTNHLTGKRMKLRPYLQGQIEMIH